MDSDIGIRRVDKLVDVQLKSGEHVWLLIHIEVQRRSESDFAERMFVYYVRHEVERIADVQVASSYSTTSIPSGRASLVTVRYEAPETM